MKRVIFYVDREWSLGRYHSDLIKYLFKVGIDGQILDYRKSYTVDEVQELARVTDYFISSAHGINILIEEYQVPKDQLICLLYHTFDAHELQRLINVQEIAQIATVSELLLPFKSIFKRDIKLIRFGINVNSFKSKLPNKLEKIGFAGEFNTRQETEELKMQKIIEARRFKRGYLAEEIAYELGLQFYRAVNTRYTYVSMPGFYNAVDCVICCSEDEGAGGPVLEGGAAGRLIITTNVGSYQNFVTVKGADGISVAEDDFKKEAKDLINYYRSYPGAFRDRCAEIREYAIKKYDMENTIESWCNLLDI